MAANRCNYDGLLGSEDQHLKLQKPRFSLASVLQDRPELTMDDDPDKYLQNQQTQLEASIKDEFVYKEANKHATGGTTALEKLARRLRELGSDTTSSTALNELTVRPKPNDIITPNSTSDRHDFRMLEADGPKRLTPTIDYNALLARINTRLDAFTIDYSIIPAPTTTNPLLSTADIVLLQCRPSFTASSTEKPTYFAIHKTLLSTQSHAFFAHAHRHPTTKVFNVDTDRYTLACVVDWLYHLYDYDMNRLDADQLLALLCVSLDIQIAALHNAIITLLVKRHTDFPEHLRFANKFCPGKESVRRVYEKSRKGDGTRKCVAYLLAFARETNNDYDGDGEMERCVRMDVTGWEAKEGMLGRWEKMPAKTFFLRTGRGGF